MKRNLISTFLLIAVFAGVSFAEVRLPKILSSNMVLQRGEKINVWGWANPGEEIQVTFAEKSESTKAKDDGTWKLSFNKMQAGGPYEMIIQGENTITLKNILIGDVWVCSGQSNMEWPMDRINDSEAEIAAADFPQIRIFNVPNNVQFEPAADIPAGEWQVCTPENIRGFSAVGYFFGRDIHKSQNIPIGLLGSNWGGTVSETWTSKEAIQKVAEFKPVVEQLDTLDLESFTAAMDSIFAPVKASFENTQGGLVDGKALWAAPDLDTAEWDTMMMPTLWEAKGYPGMDGFVWFRKEIELPAEVAENGITLGVGRIDDSDWTWVNGKKVGETIQAYDQPRVYQIDAGILKPGKNIIAVRCEDTGGGGGIWGEPEHLFVKSDTFKLSLAGPWLYRISPIDFSYNRLNIGPNDFPTLLFNGMIHPLLNYKIKGAIWYQGESNAGRAYQYRSIFPLMIKDWRKQWEAGDFPFLFVQLANFTAPAKHPGESDWAELREAQNMALELKNTGVAVIIDIGEANDIHPRNKQDVGKRLALAGRHVAYDEDIVYSGPMFKKMHIKEKRSIIEFDHIGSGLVAHDKYGYVKGFTIAGADKKFHWAKAEIRDNKVIVWSEEVEKPVAVRYGWANNPDDVNLYNKEGLPASPFRTDDWPGITVKNHLPDEE